MIRAILFLLAKLHHFRNPGDSRTHRNANYSDAYALSDTFSNFLANFLANVASLRYNSIKCVVQRSCLDDVQQDYCLANRICD
jgi:hypothetical protein